MFLVTREKEKMMRTNRIALLTALALGLGALSAVAAEEKLTSHDGLVVSVAEKELVMTDLDGSNKHEHDIGPTVKISIDGKPAKLADLKKGDKIKVYQNADDAVVKVEATRKTAS